MKEVMYHGNHSLNITCATMTAKICKLLDYLPTSLLLEGSLRINLSSYSAGNNLSIEKTPECALYICSAEDVESVHLDIPHVKIFRFSAINMCSSWLKMIVEEELAKKYIFLKQCWRNTAEILPLPALSGLLTSTCRIYMEDNFSNRSHDLDLVDNSKKCEKGITEAFHKLVVHHCVQYNLPHLLDLYIDHHLFQDYNSFCTLQQAAGDCHWANWLLSSRTKGSEYQASFSNARSNLYQQRTPDSNRNILEIDEIIHTVDDIAQVGGEMAALATLMYAAAWNEATHSASKLLPTSEEKKTPRFLFWHLVL